MTHPRSLLSDLPSYYFPPCFPSAPDIQRQLPVEAKAFLAVDKQLKDIMRR